MLDPLSCEICGRQQEADPQGLYLITKGWHNLSVSQTAFCTSLSVSYPAHRGKVICPECLLHVTDSYQKLITERFGK
jgi:hypothetical protein